MKKIILKIQGADGEICKVIIPTIDNYQIRSYMEEHFSDFKLLGWTVERIYIIDKKL